MSGQIYAEIKKTVKGSQMMYTALYIVTSVGPERKTVKPKHKFCFTV